VASLLPPPAEDALLVARPRFFHPLEVCPELPCVLPSLLSGVEKVSRLDFFGMSHSVLEMRFFQFALRRFLSVPGHSERLFPSSGRYLKEIAACPRLCRQLPALGIRPPGRADSVRGLRDLLFFWLLPPNFNSLTRFFFSPWADGSPAVWQRPWYDPKIPIRTLTFSSFPSGSLIPRALQKR